MPSPPDDQALVERDMKVDALRSHLLRGEEGLNDFPAALQRVIEEEAWRERIDWRTKERFTFDAFAQFVIADPPAGLGASIDLIKRLVAKTPTELPLALALRPGRGRRDLFDNGIEVRDLTGNTRAYLLDRLRRDHPALHARVEAGDMKLAAAAREAGITRRQRTIRIDSPAEAVKALLRVFTADELRAALDEHDAD